jgi:uncharacterized protein (TIRG00374 family)
LNKRLKDILRFIFFLTVGGGILYFIFRSQNRKYLEDCALRGIAPEDCSLWDKLQTDFLSVDVFWLVLVLLAFMVSNLSRAHRWLMLMKGMGIRARFSTAFWTIMLGYFANLFIPRIGEVIRGAVFGRYEKVPVEKVLGTIFVDRALDVISLLFAILLAFILQFNVLYGYLQENFGDSVLAQRWILGGAVGFVLVVALLWMFRKRIANTRLFGRVRNVLVGFVDGIRSIRTVKNIPLFILHTVVIWMMYYLMTYFCFKAFGPTAELGGLAALMIFVFGGLGIVFPSPGGMGTYHGMVMVGLALYGVASDDAFSFANILYFSVQLFCNILFGLTALLILPLLNRRKANENT